MCFFDPLLRRSVVTFLFPTHYSPLTTHYIIPPMSPLNSQPTASKIKHVIAIASGKGGVGKSTTAVNLACALQQQGFKVGLLDADIYGPNQPHMFGLAQKNHKLATRDDKYFEPQKAYGIKNISMGYLVDTNTPMIWRGPMVSTALQQLYFQTDWGQLDYLLIDLPPGTGDIQLTLCKKIPLTGAIIVTTPQDIALLDARKGLEMFKKVEVPVLGVIENMSTHTCSQCGHTEAIFGELGAQQMAQECGVPVLGQLPLDIAIRKAADAGEPIVVAAPDSAVAQSYSSIAKHVTA